MYEDYFSTDEMHKLCHYLRRADPTIFDAAMRLLEDDPKWAGSGYTKETIWHYIGRYALSSDDLARLEYAALRYLERPMTPEFKYMCLAMSRLATPAFWDHVKSRLNSPFPVTQLNATCLYAYSAGAMAGEKLRLEMKHDKPWYWRMSQYSLKLDERLEEAVYAPANWNAKGIVRQKPNPADLPIIYYNPTQDMKYATLDMRACNHTNMLQALQTILSTGMMDNYTEISWLYTIYLLRQIDDPQAVPILSEFMETKFEFTYDVVRKRLLAFATLKVLKHYGTPEAQAVIRDHTQPDLEWIRYYEGSRDGWITRYP